MADTMSHFAQNVDSSYLDEFGGGLESKDKGNFNFRTTGANRGYISSIDIPEGTCFLFSFDIYFQYTYVQSF